MKRFILSLTAAAVLSMPMAASALEKMDNNQLKSSTGQAGVSIAVDDVVIYQKSLADTTYWDTDGTTAFSGDTAPGEMTETFGKVNKAGIMIDHHANMEKLITIDAILDDEDYGVEKMRKTFGQSYIDLHAEEGDDVTTDEEGDVDTDDNPTSNGIADYVDDNMNIGIAAAGTSGVNGDPLTGSIDGFTNNISPLSIDVGTCKALSTGLQYNMGKLDGGSFDKNEKQVAGVVIGLPTIEITTYNTKNIKDIKLLTGDGEGAGNDLAVNTDHSFIQIEKSGASRMAILGGTLEIAPH